MLQPPHQTAGQVFYHAPPGAVAFAGPPLLLLASANAHALHLHTQQLHGPPQHHHQPHPQGPPGALGPALPAAVITREEVIARIEAFVRAWLVVLTDPNVAEPPTFEVLRRTTSNVTLVQQPAGQQHQGGGGLPALVHGEGMVVKKLRGKGARSYAAIFAVLSFAHRLLLSGQRATSREFFYHVKTQATFRVQSDADSAVIDAASLLGVPRHQLGIVGAAKGLVAGRFRFRVRLLEEPAAADGDDGQGGQGQGPAVVTMREWQDCSTGTLVDSDWMTEVMEVEFTDPLRPPHYIVVVEKECVWQRLLADGATDMAGGLILITGKGYPDLSTRACLKALAQALRIPVIGLCDCNPHGMALLLTYKVGSSRMPESHNYVVDLKWLGLRPNQVLSRLDLPDDAFQPFQPTDQAKARVLLESEFCASHPRWRQEAAAMAREHLKCELEALDMLPTPSGRRDQLAQFVQRALLQGDYI